MKIKENNKVVKALFGDYYKKIRTFGIISAENPQGKQISRNENSYRTRKLIDLLKNGSIMFVDTFDNNKEKSLTIDKEKDMYFKKLDGVYEGKQEHSFMIFNVSLETMKNIAKQFNQESFFFGELREIKEDEDNRDYTTDIYYYQDSNGKGNYELLDTCNKVSNRKDASDFLSQHKGYKFKIDMPIFEYLDNMPDIVNEEALSKSLDDSRTGKSRYLARHFIYKKPLEESNKVTKALFGDYLNKIKTFGILTAENPMGKKTDASENNIRNSELKNDLKSMVIQYKHLSGSYGNKEHSFMLFNCSLEDLKYLSKKYSQESFFYGVVKTIKDDMKERDTTSSISFYVWDELSQDYLLVETSKIVNVGDFEDFYSKHKGIKFNIDMEVFKEDLDNLKEIKNVELLEKTLDDKNYIDYTKRKKYQDRILAYKGFK